MGHAAFVLLHLIVIVFVFPALIVTIPLHLIYGAVRRGTDPVRTARRLAEYERLKRIEEEHAANEAARAAADVV
jgi:hypothetical protein